MHKTLVGSFIYKISAESAFESFQNNGLLFSDFSLISRDDNYMPQYNNLYMPGLGEISAWGNIQFENSCVSSVSDGLSDLGIPKPQSARYEEEIRRGKTIIALRADLETVNEAARIMVKNAADGVNIF